MSDSFVQVAADGPGKKVDASELTVGVNTVERQRIVLADNATDVGLAKITDTLPGLSDYGLVVRPVGTLIVSEQADPAAYAPGYDKTPTGSTASLSVDTGNNLVTRSTVLTDEGTARVNFANSSVSVSLGSVTISGSGVTGTFSTADVHVGDYFKLDADPQTSWVQITFVTETDLSLASAYSGGTTGAASRAIVRVYDTTAGATKSISNGSFTTTLTGSTAGVVSMSRRVDYAPLSYRTKVTPVASFTSSSFYVGMQDGDVPASAKWYARIQFTGSGNIICQTARNPTTAPSGTEIETTSTTIYRIQASPAAVDVRIDLIEDRAVFYIDNQVVARHYTSLPQVFDVMNVGQWFVQSAASTNSIVTDYMLVKNHNRLQVGLFSDAESIQAAQPNMDRNAYSTASIVPINTDLLILDCSQYRSLSIQCTSMGTSGVVTGAFSNDGTNWVSQTLMTPGGVQATTFNAAGLWTTNVIARYFRLRMTTATTAGTTAVIVQGIQSAISQPVAQPVSGSVTATLSGTGTVTPSPAAATGTSTSHTAVSAATTNATSVKTSAGVIGVLVLSNTTASAKYFKLFNKASAPTVGTDSPVHNLLIPANSTIPIHVGPFGWRMSTGIAYAITGGVALLDTTVVAADDVLVNIAYT